MDTLLIEVTSDDAYQLLKQLEKLHLIRFIRKSDSPQKLSEKFAGKLATNDAQNLLRHIEQSRNEWDS